MTRPYGCAALAALLLALAGPAIAAREPGSVALIVDRTSVSTKLGRSFSFTSTITNRRTVAAGGLIAHLNVLSLRDGVYVDPEDWSSNRTRYLPALPAGGSTTITWKLKAVNAGSFAVYVAVLRPGGTARPPTTGPEIHVAVAERRTLDSGGILPLALGVPGALALLSAGVRIRRRRLSGA
jgi:hypothetical protein